MKKRTGLRNRFRTGRRSYSVKNKAKRADRYSNYDRGVQLGFEYIAGTAIGDLIKLRKDS